MARKLIPTSELHTKGIRYSRQHIQRLIQQGKFPKPVKGVGKENAFDEAEIDVHIEGLLAKRGRASSAEAPAPGPRLVAPPSDATRQTALTLQQAEA